jgi:hypothetical protein
MMSSIHCIACGAEVAVGSRFCAACGRLLTTKTRPLVWLLAIIGGIVAPLVIVGAIVRNSDNSPSAPETAQTKQPSRSGETAKYDEAAAVIKACGKPSEDHPQKLNAGTGSEGRALVYRKYNTELWFYRGPESHKWMLMSGFAADGDDSLLVSVLNKRMPCMEGRLQDHYNMGHTEQEAADIQKNVDGASKSLVNSRHTFATELDRQLLDMGIESKTYAVGKDATTLVIQDALAGRVRANQISQNTQLMSNLRVLGFKKLKYNNGFEGEMFTGFSWNLTK